MHSNASIGRIRFVALLMSLAILSADAAPARPRCTGPFKGTCLRPLFRHFDAAGACVGDVRVSDSGERTVTQCWRNGATVVGTLDPASESWSVVYRNSRGKPVAWNTLVITSTAFESTFERKGKRWIVRRPVLDPNEIDVTCPDGRTETYSSGLVLNTPAEPRCTGMDFCPPGPCR